MAMSWFDIAAASAMEGRNRRRRRNRLPGQYSGLGVALRSVLGYDPLDAVLVDFRTGNLVVRSSTNSALNYDDVMPGKMAYSGSSKYRRNGAGVLVSATGILPEYDTSRVNVGYRSEPQDVNRLLWSSDLSNAAWSSSNVPVATLGPDGTMSAWILTDNSTIGYNVTFQEYAIIADTATHRVRVRIKKTTAPAPVPGINLALTGGTAVSSEARLDPFTGLATGTATVSDMGGWWELCCSITNNGTNTLARALCYPAIRSTLAGADDATQTGSNTFWCPQAGNNFVTSSPIMTGAAQVTRAADVLYVLLSTLPWDADTGTLIVRSRTDAAWGTFSPSIGINGPGGALTDAFTITHNYEGTTAFSGVKSSVEQFRLKDGAASNAFVTSAGAWAPNNVAFTRNGGAVTLTDAVADTNLTVADRLYFGSRSAANWLQGHVLWAVYVPQRLTNAQLQTLSAMT